jgi:hypothetical protein
MAVDVVDFDTTTGHVFGLFARQSDIGVGTTNGYILGYNVSTANFFIDRIENELPALNLASANLPLSPSNEYSRARARR